MIIKCITFVYVFCAFYCTPSYNNPKGLAVFEINKIKFNLLFSLETVTFSSYFSVVFLFIFLWRTEANASEDTQFLGVLLLSAVRKDPFASTSMVKVRYRKRKLGLFRPFTLLNLLG